MSLIKKRPVIAIQMCDNRSGKLELKSILTILNCKLLSVYDTIQMLANRIFAVSDGVFTGIVAFTNSYGINTTTCAKQ